MLPHWLTPCSCTVKSGAPCPQAARFQVEIDGKTFTPCQGHAQGKVFQGLDRVELPEMFATDCYSGDTWVTCDRHALSFALHSSKKPKRIHTLVGCEICSVERDEI